MEDEFNVNEGEAPDVTINEIEELCRVMAELKNDIASKELVVDAAKKELARLYANAMSMLEAVDKDSYKSKHGTIHLRRTTVVGIPKGEDKKKFFEYLKEKDLFDEVTTVNPSWLSSYYRQEADALKKLDPFSTLQIPGIGEPYVKTEARFRK
jgi:hypothetical protein